MARRDAVPAIPISEARRRLFELVNEVVTGRTRRIALSHRGHAEAVVLVRAGELAKMDAELAAVGGSQISRAGSAGAPARSLRRLMPDAR